MAMKTKPIFCVLFAVIFTTITAQPPGKDFFRDEDQRTVFYDQINVDERTYNDSTGSYVIRFTYGMFAPWTPVGGDEDDIRYSAFIEVFKLEDCVQILVGHGFRGTYSPDGCIYDEGSYLVSEARKIELRADNSRD